MHWDCEFQWAVRSGPWKLSWVDDTPDTQHLKDYEHAPMGNGWFLANLTEDITEQHNHFAAEPGLAAQLHTLHTTWRTEVGLPPLTHPGP